MTIPQMIPRKKRSQVLSKTFVFSSKILKHTYSCACCKPDIPSPGRTAESVLVCDVCVPDPGSAGDDLQGLVSAHVVAPLHAPGHSPRPQGDVVVITIPGPRPPGPRQLAHGGAVPGTAGAARTFAPHVTITEQVTTARENYKNIITVSN